MLISMYCSTLEQNHQNVCLEFNKISRYLICTVSHVLLWYDMFGSCDQCTYVCANVYIRFDAGILHMYICSYIKSFVSIRL